MLSLPQPPQRIFRSLIRIANLTPLSFTLSAQHSLPGRFTDSLTSPRMYSGRSDNPHPSAGSGTVSGQRQKTKYPFAGPTGKIRRTLQADKHTKWGLLIYRCDYTNDKAWTKFLSNIHHMTARHLVTLGAKDLQDGLEMTVKEDIHTLEGATVEQVRGIFNDWVQSDEAKSENNGTPYPYLFQYPRYTYCVHVDADSIDSVVARAPQPPELDDHEVGYVTLVRLVHEDYMEGVQINQGNLDEQDDEDHGENYAKMNHVKVPLSYLGAESYGSLDEDSTWSRYVEFRRADGVSFANS